MLSPKRPFLLSPARMRPLSPHVPRPVLFRACTNHPVLNGIISVNRQPPALA